MRRNSKSTTFEDTLASGKKLAFRRLAQRDHSSQELEEKLRQKGFSDATTSKVINELKQMKLIDDERFVETWSRFRIAHHHFGPHRLREELLKKGISSEDIAAYMQTISRTYDFVDEVEKTLLQRYPDPSQLKGKTMRRRAFDFLRRKGHETETILKIFKKHRLS